MSSFNIKEKNIIYLDPKTSDFSNIAAGLLIQAIGNQRSVAYINFENKAIKLTNFIENVSLSYSFVKALNRFHVDIYNFKDENKISKTIIPLVEFCMISTDMFYNSLNNYDLIIIDNYNSKYMSNIKIKSVIENNPKAQVILITANEKIFKNISIHFNTKIHCKYTKNKTITTNLSSIVNIVGDAMGKSLYSIGYLLRQFLYKKDVKLIYFDKGDNIYGDAVFFKALKKWVIENNLYGTFDFVKTGIKRYTTQGYRIENTILDRKEAKDTLMLLKTALKKQTPVVADELNTIIYKNILKIEEILPILNNVKNELIITGKTSHKELLNISKDIIDINLIT